MTDQPVEKVSQEEMQSQFQTRYTALLEENKKLAAKIRDQIKKRNE